MVEMIEIICKNNNIKILVPFGSSIKGICKFAGYNTEHPILGAYVNNKVQNTDYKVYMPKTVRFFDIKNPNGRRMYAMSLMFLFYKAVKDIFPKGDLNIHHSMSKGYYSEINNIGELDDEKIQLIKSRMHDLIKEDLPFITKTIPTQEAASIYRQVGLESKARLVKESKRLFVDIDYLGDTINHFYYPLVPSTSYLKVFDLVQYNKGLLLIMPDKEDPTRVTMGRNKQGKMFKVFQEYEEWIRILGTSYVSDLNNIVTENKYSKLIQVSEALHEKRYSQIADEIFKKRNDIKIVLIAGPSSSGKTTSCRRIATQLSVLGFRPVQLSLDDYFLDREFTPKKEDGDYDFESIDALDIDLFNKQMNSLLEGKEVSIPRYNFIKGKKEYNGNIIKPQEKAIFIIEGIHALNPKLSDKIDRKSKYNIFVSALTQISLDKHNLISSSDNRLIRRIVRDHNYRGYSAIDTLSRWQSVRAGEEEYIFPYQENADSIFNSSLLYEIGVLKTYAEPLLGEVPQNDVTYAEAKRLLRFLSNFKIIDADYIPPTSIMREFLGGSSFEY